MIGELKNILRMLLFLFLTIGFVQSSLAENDDFVLSTSGEPVPKAYLESIAELILQSGDYENWSLEEKREMLTLMKQNDLASAMTTSQVLAATEEEIDSAVLSRYGVSSQPNDLGVISLTRIAWVELGPYTEWTNETWVWYSQMMFRLGLWNESNDVDVYEEPGAEAITPDEAVALAKQYLKEQNVLTEEEIGQAHARWYYCTHASDVTRDKLEYQIIIYTDDNQRYFVAMSPSGKIK